MLQKLAKLFWCKPLVTINGFKLLYTKTISIVEWFPDLLPKRITRPYSGGLILLHKIVTTLFFVNLNHMSFVLVLMTIDIFVQKQSKTDEFVFDNTIKNYNNVFYYFKVVCHIG